MANEQKPPSEESLFAAMAEAEEQARAAREQRLAVEASLSQLRQTIERMESAVSKLAASERVLKAGMEEAAKAAFEKQAQQLVHKVEWQVRESCNRLDIAVNRATHHPLPWTWILAAFLLGVVGMGVYSYYKIEEPLENTWHSQAVLYQEMKSLESHRGPAPAARPEKHRETKAPQTQPEQP